MDGMGLDQAEANDGLGMDTSVDGSKGIGKGDSFVEGLKVQGERIGQSEPLGVSNRAQEDSLTANCNLGDGQQACCLAHIVSSYGTGADNGFGNREDEGLGQADRMEFDEGGDANAAC